MYLSQNILEASHFDLENCDHINFDANVFANSQYLKTIYQFNYLI